MSILITSKSSSSIAFTAPTSQTFYNFTYSFTVTSANASQGSIYTSTGTDFYLVTSTIVASTTLLVAYNSASGATPSGSTLALVSGQGDATITFSANSQITGPYSITIPTPAPLYIEIIMVGAGGGGGGGGTDLSGLGGNGTNGGNSSFNQSGGGHPQLIAYGGLLGAGTAAAPGGLGGIGTLANGYTGQCIQGSAGGAGVFPNDGAGSTPYYASGANGGSNPLFGGSPQSAVSSPGANATIGTGGGGAGGGSTNQVQAIGGAGGGAGGYVKAVLSNPVTGTVYSIQLGTGGSGGSAGIGGYAGGNGADGNTTIIYHYQ